MSAVFDFNDSLNDVAPVSPMLLPVHVMGYGKSVYDFLFYVTIIFLSSQPRLSSVSVVFDFSASPNDVAPVAPILLSVDEKRKRKE